MFQAECRIVLCPSGFIRNKDDCEQISTNWLTSSYFVQLILTPVDAQLLPRSYFTKLTDVEQRSPETWFNPNITPIDYLEMYGKLVSINGEAYVGELLAQIGRLISHFDLAEEVNILHKAMEHVWTIKFNNTVYSFLTKFYRYASYVERGSDPRYDLISSLSRHKIYEARPPPKVYTFLFYYLKLSRKGKASAVLKKTHFCEKVKLHRSEWIGGFQEVRLNVTAAHTVESDEEATALHEPLRSNGTGDVSSDGSVSSNGPLPNNRSTLENESVPVASKILGDSEFDFYLDNTGEPVVEICVEDFNPDYRVQGTAISDPASKSSCARHAIYHLLIFGPSLIVGKWKLTF